MCLQVSVFKICVQQFDVFLLPSLMDTCRQPALYKGALAASTGEEPSWKLIYVVMILLLLVGICAGSHLGRWTAGSTPTTSPSTAKKNSNQAMRIVEHVDLEELTVEALRVRLCAAGQSKQGSKEYLKDRLGKLYASQGKQVVVIE